MPRASDRSWLAINRRVVSEGVLVVIVGTAALGAATCAYQAWRSTAAIPAMQTKDEEHDAAIDAVIIAATKVQAQQNVIILMLDRIDRREGGPGAPDDMKQDALRELRQ